MKAKKLQYDYMRDLIVDIRCARRDGLNQYATECTHQFRALWKTRHNAKIGPYGMPLDLPAINTTEGA
jgi:hypothetical protein